MSESPINSNVARDIVERLERAFGPNGAPHAAISHSDIEYLSRALAELDWTRTERNMARAAGKRIPVKAAGELAKAYGLRQALIIGFDGERTHVVTYGRTKRDCELAAQAQDFWTGKIREFSFTEKVEPQNPPNVPGG